MSQTDGAAAPADPTAPVLKIQSSTDTFATKPIRSEEPAEKALPRNPRPAILTGVFVLAIVVLGIGGWSFSAPLSSGVIAPGVIIFEGRRQSVQHLEGGIVSEILVREGTEVKQGDVLFRIDTTQVGSRVARLSNLLLTNEAQAARLMAEINGTNEIVFSDNVIRDAKLGGWESILDRERSIFDERRISLAGQIELLEAQASQITIEITGLNAQETAQEDQLSLLAKEISDLQTLLDNELVPRARVTGLQREAARLRGLNGEIIARRARAFESVSESRLQIEQLRQQFRQEVVSVLRETENTIADLDEQLVSAKDILSRTDILAPQSGRVQNVTITTVGAIIQPGRSLLEIAPANDRLMVEARVAVNDIDAVSIGQSAEVRVSALNLRMTPAVFGDVISVSGDRLIDERTQAGYFLIEINIPPAELEKLGGQSISAGMPAEVILPTGERTLINYLISPLTDAMRHGLLER
jgi:HlyD family type I secretion membrane fusion protein